MKDPEKVRDALHDANSVLEHLKKIDLEKNPGAALMYEDAIRRRNFLREELDDASTPELIFSIEGQPVIEHTVQVGFLSRALGALQETLASIGQGVEETPTERGLIRQSIREAVGLRLASLSPGSVKLTLLGPPLQGMDQKQLITSDEMTIFAASVDLFIDVVGSAQTGDSEEVLQEIAGIGKRAAKHLTVLSKAVSGEEVETRLLWRHPGSEDRIVDFDAMTASHLVELLTKTEVEEHETVMRGRLVGASLPRGWFDLEIEDGDVISGRVAPQLIEEAKAYWLRDCTATIRVAIARSRVDDKQATSYTLVDVNR